MNYYKYDPPPRYIICQSSIIPKSMSDEISIIREETFKYCNKLLNTEKENDELKIKNEEYNKIILHQEKLIYELNIKLKQNNEIIINLTDMILIIKNDFETMIKSIFKKYENIENIYNNIIKKQNEELFLFKKNYKEELNNITEPLYNSLHDIKFKYNDLKKMIKKMNIYKEKLIINESEIKQLNEIIINIKNTENKYLEEINNNKIKIIEDDKIKLKYINIIKSYQLTINQNENTICHLNVEIQDLKKQCITHEKAIKIYKNIIFKKK